MIAVALILITPLVVAAAGVVTFFVGFWKHSIWLVGGGLLAAIVGAIGTYWFNSDENLMR